MPATTGPDASGSQPSLDLSTPTYKRVGDLLRKDILSGRFSRGARLKIADLSRMYGVSQMPVREALQQMQGEGLVDIQPNRGASIRKIDERMVGNIYDLRSAIESLLVGRAAETIGEAQMTQLYGIQARFELAVAQGNAEEEMRANRDFHHFINAIGDNPEALEVTEKYSDLIYGLRRHFGFRAGRIAQVASEHRQLLAALAAHDAEAARRVTLEHCRNAKDDLIALLREEAAAQ